MAERGQPCPPAPAHPFLPGRGQLVDGTGLPREWPWRESRSPSQALCPAIPKKPQDMKMPPCPPPLPALGSCPGLQRTLRCLTEGLASRLQPGLCPRPWDKRAKREGKDETLETLEEHRAKPVAPAEETSPQCPASWGPPAVSLGAPAAGTHAGAMVDKAGARRRPQQNRKGSGGYSPGQTVEYDHRQEPGARSQPASPS